MLQHSFCALDDDDCWSFLLVACSDIFYSDYGRGKGPLVVSVVVLLSFMTLLVFVGCKREHMCVTCYSQSSAFNLCLHF